MSSLAWNYGQEACDLMIEEVGKHPSFYKLGLHAIERPEELTGEPREAWESVMNTMKTDYPEVQEESVWKAWRWIRRYYNTIKCPQKYAGKIEFLDQMRIEKQENAAHQKEAWKTSAIVIPKVSTAELRKTIPGLVDKSKPKDEKRPGLRSKNEEGLAQCGIRKNLTFDSTYTPKAYQPKKAAGIQGRGRMSVIDSFAVKYGEQACHLLFEHIGQYPAIYTPSCNIPDPKSLNDSARKCWFSVMDKMNEKYPKMSSQDAWKAWRTLRRNYNNSSCPKNWVGKLPFLNDLLATKESNYVRNPRRRGEDPDYEDEEDEEEEDEEEDDRWSEKDEADKFQDILSNLNPSTAYDEGTLLDNSLDGSADEYADDYDDSANEQSFGATPMQLLLKKVEQANEREQEEQDDEPILVSPSTSSFSTIIKSSSTPYTVRTAPISLPSSSSRPTQAAIKRKVPPGFVIMTKKSKPSVEAPKSSSHDAFKKLIREKWNEMSELDNPKAHLSLFKKEIMTVVNKAFGDAGM